LEQYATAQQVFIGGLVFARVGAMVMLIPGFGEQPAPTRIRLAFALLMALVLAPVVGHTLPAIPQTSGAMGGYVIREVLIGLMLGAILRMFLASLATAGEIISIQTTLSFAQTTNPLLAQGGSSLASFLSLLGVVLIMATDLHHLFLSAIANSYTLFPATKGLLINDWGMLAVRTLSSAFALGVQLAAPVLVFSLVFNLATGLIGRAMPQFQIFFAAAPLQVLLGLSLFALSLGTMGMVWLTRYRELLSVFG